jgi:hypothetical protein
MHRERYWAPEGHVAQVSNLLYRRLPVGRLDPLGRVCGLEIRDTASWKPALRLPVSESLYHSLSTSSLFAKNLGRRARPAPIHQSNNPSIPFLFGCGSSALGNIPARWRRSLAFAGLLGQALDMAAINPVACRRQAGKLEISEPLNV